MDIKWKWRFAIQKHLKYLKTSSTWTPHVPGHLARVLPEHLEYLDTSSNWLPRVPKYLKYLDTSSN